MYYQLFLLGRDCTVYALDHFLNNPMDTGYTFYQYWSFDTNLLDKWHNLLGDQDFDIHQLIVKVGNKRKITKKSETY
jgi:hypothetical protein